MADAPGHLLGQLIGGVLEIATEPVLQSLCDAHELFLDKKGARPGVRSGHLLSLLDNDGNKHDLDFVIERATRDGRPGHYAAFIECAWRRFTKHSKAKAQEIQGAVLPLIGKWATVGPVPAAVIAGRWSRPSAKQLESFGFVVLQLDFTTTVDCFRSFGVDIEGPTDKADDKVPDAFWQVQVEAFRKLNESEVADLAASLRNALKEDFDSFATELENRVIRTVQIVIFHPVHGRTFEFETLEAAIRAIHGYDATESTHPLLRYEFEVRYTNNDVIKGSCSTVESAEEFLRQLM
ncbi:MAG: hypothetical protein U1E37_10155 [Sphingomonadaceae bacterium]